MRGLRCCSLVGCHNQRGDGLDALTCAQLRNDLDPWEIYSAQRACPLKEAYSLGGLRQRCELNQGSN